VFDVDFTLAQPGPNLGPDGYRSLGLRYGLDLDPMLYDEARRAAFETLERHPELEHDEETWVLFTQRVIEGMGGRGDTYACAAEMTHAWEHADHFELYDDVLPTLAALRSRGLRLGLLSNTARDLELFVAHHALAVDAVLTSRVHGKIKPHEAIFQRMLELLAVDAAEAAMVGDSPEDDIEGALTVGMHAVLIDREDRYPQAVRRLSDLRGLPVALGLV
jgi:HAD superfamily hydrolase (TIGR01549 family)